jgi:hypothetical protein
MEQDFVREKLGHLLGNKLFRVAFTQLVTNCYELSWCWEINFN